MSTGFADRLAARAGSRTFPPRCQFTSSLIRNWSAHGDSTGKRHSCRFSKRRPPLPQSPSNADSFCRDCPVACGVDSVQKRQECRFPVGGSSAPNGQDARSPMNAPLCQHATARQTSLRFLGVGNRPEPQPPQGFVLLFPDCRVCFLLQLAAGALVNLHLLLGALQKPPPE